MTMTSNGWGATGGGHIPRARFPPSSQMLRIVTPAPLEDVLSLYEMQYELKPLRMRAAILQTARSESVGFYTDRIVAAALLYPTEEDPARDVRELLFACRHEADRHMLPIIRYARLTLLALQKDGYVLIRARTRGGYVKGR